MNINWTERAIGPHFESTRSRLAGIILLSIVWAGLVVAGFVGLAVYGNSPGEDDQVSPLFRPNLLDDKWTLLVGVHPKCPCTTATVHELECLLKQHDRRLVCRAIIYHPEDASLEWMSLPLVNQLRNMPGVTVQADRDGQDLTQLGILVSGGVRLFDPMGNLQFRGGITSSRGHRGLNLGSETIGSLLRNEPAYLDHTPVFGCKISCTTENRR